MTTDESEIEFSNKYSDPVWQRIPVAVSCGCFIALLRFAGSKGLSLILFVVVDLMACIEKLAATANTVAVERDWVCF